MFISFNVVFRSLFKLSNHSISGSLFVCIFALFFRLLICYFPHRNSGRAVFLTNK